MKGIKLLFLFLFLHVCSFAQKISVQEYIDKYREIAVSEMIRSGVPADITLAQGVLETENGNSDLVKRSNNHFGIKCKETWTGERVYHDDDEKGECFRKYDKAEDSYRDHSDFLKTRPNYASLFKLNPTDYKAWAYGLKKAGYATNPNYPKILIKTIEEYNLNQLSIDVVKSDNLFQDTVNQKKETTASIVEKSIQKFNGVFKSKNPSLSKFNGLNAFYAEEGVSLLAIASNFDIPLSDLIEYNDFQSDGLLQEKQWIFLEKKPKESKREYYITTSYEGIHYIAQLNAVQMNSLMELNGLNPLSIVKPNTYVKLRSDARIPDTKNSTNSIKHQVKSKEGLYSISKKYNVSVEQIKRLNNLQSDELTIGQELIISK